MIIEWIMMIFTEMNEICVRAGVVDSIDALINAVALHVQ